MMEAGVVKTLCEHARSTNTNLQLNAVWALKHLVFSASNDVKVSCVEELGQGWLLQLISDDIEDTVMQQPNNSGQEEQNTTGGVPVSMEYTNDDDDDHGKMVDSIGLLSQPQHNNPGDSDIAARVSSRHHARISALMEAEADPRIRAMEVGAAVQEQGLDFIRNLISGDNASTMIDYIFSSLGQDRVFQILKSKLRLRPSKKNSSREQTDLIKAVCYIMVHLAASHAQHRQILISQTELLKLLLPMFDHPRHEVRSPLAWIVINLTWADDTADHKACKARAQELKDLGFLSKLESLESQDPELDVRERTKTALYQMRTMLQSPG
jgi:armadillo repeat-containing protein 8